LTYRKKLIEVTLPLDAVNKASVRENYIYKGNPTAVHKWWSRKPFATCRAVLFASLVDDPSNDLPAEKAKVERDRLFGLIEQLVIWENSNDEDVLAQARAEINAIHRRKSAVGTGSILRRRFDTPRSSTPGPRSTWL